MASSYSSSLFLELMETGANASTWGTNTNENLKVIDSYLSGVATIGVSGGTVNVASANADPTSDAANKILEFTGVLTSNATVTLPNVEGNYLISTLNMTFDGFTVDVAPFGNTGASVSLNQDAYHWVYVSGGVAKNGLSNLSSVTINGDISNVTGNVTVTGTTTLTDNVTASANVSLADDSVLNFGDGDDLQIVHDASNSSITNSTGDLLIDSDSVKIRSSTGEEYLTGVADGAVTLYYDDSAVFATADGGVTITGNATVSGNTTLTGNVTASANVDLDDNSALNFGANDDLQIVHDGTNSSITSSTGDLLIDSDSLKLRSSTGEEYLTGTLNGAVDIYYDDVVVFSTIDSGVDVQGKITVENSAVAEAHTLTDATNISLDLSVGNNFSVTLGGNRTLDNPTNETVGQCGFIIVRQDGTGGRTLAFGSEYKFIGGPSAAPNLASRTANQVDRLDYVVVSSTEIHVNATGPYS